MRSWSISPIAAADAARPPSATAASAPWNGRSANDSPRWNSWTYGLAENAISSSVTAMRIANAIPRRRAWRLVSSGSWRGLRERSPARRGARTAQRGGRL